MFTLWKAVLYPTLYYCTHLGSHHNKGNSWKQCRDQRLEGPSLLVQIQRTNQASTHNREKGQVPRHLHAEDPGQTSASPHTLCATTLHHWKNCTQVWKEKLTNYSPTQNKDHVRSHPSTWRAKNILFTSMGGEVRCITDCIVNTLKTGRVPGVSSRRTSSTGLYCFISQLHTDQGSMYKILDTGPVGTNKYRRQDRKQRSTTTTTARHTPLYNTKYTLPGAAVTQDSTHNL